MRVLVVEDETKVARFLKQALEEEGHAVDVAGDGVEGGNLASINPYDLILLDVQLPRMDGLHLAGELRRSGLQCPILMLTSRDSTQDVVRGLNAGADDYLTKPFALEELLARVNAITRRQLGPATGILRYQDLEMDRLKRLVKRGGKALDFSPREFRLLEFFLLNPERVVSRTTLLEKVWDMSFDPETNVVDAHMSNLRKKLEDGDRPRLIQTVRGAGYALRTEAAD
ncbi:MAG: response regulator transcription factor [Gemmatimonadota bacterium]